MANGNEQDPRRRQASDFSWLPLILATCGVASVVIAYLSDQGVP
jgi:hypothetical protein